MCGEREEGVGGRGEIRLCVGGGRDVSGVVGLCVGREGRRVCVWEEGGKV